MSHETVLQLTKHDGSVVQHAVPLTERPLTFEPVDREAFPAVDLAYRVGGLGSTFPAVMNASNEVAVMAFLEGKIAKWWMPDDVQFVEQLPHTATGKLQKMKLREIFKDYRFPGT